MLSKLKVEHDQLIGGPCIAQPLKRWPAKTPVRLRLGSIPVIVVFTTVALSADEDEDKDFRDVC